MVIATPATLRRERIHVVVTCTNLKTRPVPAHLRLRDVTGTRLAPRLNAWIRRLSDEATPAIPARELYAGQHWDVARRLPSTAPDLDIVMWICSAGYGLIPSDARIRPYSATFANTHADRVSSSRTGWTAWWAALQEWNGPTDGPRSLVQLAAGHSADRLLVVLSQPYLVACRADVLAAAAQLRQSSLLSVISAGTKADPELADLLLPADARLQQVVGGTRQSLNVRVAGLLLSRRHYEHDSMRTHLVEVLATQPAVRRYDRQPLSDSQVRAFIRQGLGADPAVGHTRLLRALRTAGFACEQARFATLFQAETRAAP